METPECRDFARGKCTRGDKCRFSHDNRDSSRRVFNKNGHKPRRVRNTESFEPMKRPVDMRVVVDMGIQHIMTKHITMRDLVYAPNMFSDFAPGELYDRLVREVETCGVPHDRLLKLWHGDTHYIADDHTSWKEKAPTFKMILNRISNFFDMDIQATRFNWYKDTSQWKPFHHDAAAIKQDKAALQNFTVAVSFGATRDVAFEHAGTKTVISMPQPDGSVYAFAKDTNIIWRHGILKEEIVRDVGRVSVIAWGKIGDQNVLI